jgi:hypothetical protein
MRCSCACFLELEVRALLVFARLLLVLQLPTLLVPEVHALLVCVLLLLVLWFPA